MGNTSADKDKAFYYYVGSYYATGNARKYSTYKCVGEKIVSKQFEKIHLSLGCLGV